jgi:hypothetical protein
VFLPGHPQNIPPPLRPPGRGRPTSPLSVRQVARP